MTNSTKPLPHKGLIFPVFFLFLLVTMTITKARAQDCHALLDLDTLTLRNSKIEGKWLWNKGDLLLFSIKDVHSDKPALTTDRLPSFFMEGRCFLKNTGFKITEVEKGLTVPAHLEVMVENQYRELSLRRIFRIYPETPAISCDYYLNYQSLFPQVAEKREKADGTEAFLNSTGKDTGSYMDYYPLNSAHWRFRVVAFQDVTDSHDNLVSETDLIPYRAKRRFPGNLLIAENLANGKSFFILKEAPSAGSQVNYPGYDFEMNNRGIRIPFSGFPEDQEGDGWVKGYSVTTGVGEESAGSLVALRHYLKNSVNYDPASYEMVMMNTWGDRGQDGKISEEFILKELEAAQRLGVTHFQIDDGWQQGCRLIPQLNPVTCGMTGLLKTGSLTGTVFPMDGKRSFSRPEKKISGWAFGFIPATGIAMPTGNQMLM